VKQYSAFVLYAGLGLGVLMGIAVMLFLQPLLRLLGTDTQTAAYTGSYLKIMAAGAPFAVAGGAMSNVVRADGDGKSAVISHMSGTVLNIILDPIFISLLGWGVVGAGLATLLGNLLSFILLFAVIRNKDNFSVSARDFTLRPEISLHVLSLGFPMAASTLLSSFSSVFANRLLVRYGNEAVAAQSIAGKAGMLIAMIVMGICMGMQPAISYTCGRRDRRRMRSILLGTGTASVATATVLAVIFFLGRDSFVRAFLNNGEILALGRRMILGGLAAAPFVGVYQLCSVYLQSTGRVAYATVTALMQKGLVYVPVLYGMNAAFGLTGLIFSAAVTDVVSMLAAVALCMKSAKQF
jgi:putative MATE family efflux protein